MDDAGTHSPDPEPQAAGTPGPASTSAASDAPQKKPFLAMSWPGRRRLGAAIAVVALATTGGVAIAATSDTPTPSPGSDSSVAPGSALEQKQLLEKKRMAAGEMKGKPGVRQGGVLHGEFVTPNGDDGYVTHLMQTGTITSIGDSNLGVKSDDGYTRDYVLNSDTVVNGARGWTAESKGGLATGQKVTVMATKSGDDATAMMIHAQDEKVGKGDHMMMMPGPGNLKMFRFRGGPGEMMERGGGDIRRVPMPGDEKMMREKMMRDQQEQGDRVMPAPGAPKASEPSASFESFESSTSELSSPSPDGT